MNKHDYAKVIEDTKQIFTDLSDEIWEYAELSVKEYRSAELYVRKLKELGFEVTAPFDGIETGFIGKYGSGHPVIGILAEYDALSGLSQEAALPYRSELVKNGTGHGCGHNMLGAGSLAAAYGIRKYLEDHPDRGTVIFFGCPGEEGGAAKAFYARDHVFDDVDIALTWHPGNMNEVNSGSCNSCIQTEYRFKGIASHAAGAPELGRSALDAVQLMNMGTEFMREHMPDHARIHYAITDAGGPSPNVVQPHARVLYMVRSELVKDALQLQRRLDQIADGAALMTETEVEKVFIDGCSNTVPNEVLEKLLWKNFSETELPSYTEEEWEYAKALRDSVEMKHDVFAGLKTRDPKILAEVREKSENGTRALNDFLLPLIHSEEQGMGSTDVGDVSWNIPTAQIHTVCFGSANPGHSWQNVSCGRSGIGHKGLILAGQVLCKTAIDLFENPQIIADAKEEFRKRTPEGYFCPVPADAVLKPVE